ncbi:MAG: DoxX family protein [Phycisphaerae bacterium]|nr:DoxX family protein [Phycisphaerae bacterium]
MNSIMPLLSRFVIAAAMITSGWVNCFVFVEVSSEQAISLEAIELQVITDAETGNQTTRGLNRIALLLHNECPQLGGWGTLLAWSAGALELLAGILVLVGLFTRLSAFVICIIMGTALYLVSYKINGMFSMNPFDWPLQHGAFSQLFTELCLFVLSLGVVVGGAGALSIDRYQTGKYVDPKLSADKSTKKGDD